MRWTDKATSLFRSRAIDPEVAYESGVREENGQLVYPTGKVRSFNGAHRNPPAHVRPWWVFKGEGDTVLLTEGETDGLAARTSLAKSPSATGYAALSVLAVPGCQYPPARLRQGLVHYGLKVAYVAYDSDQAGRKARERVLRELEQAGIAAIPVVLPDGEDLASWLASGGDLASLLADSEAAYEVARKGVTFAEVPDSPLRWLWRERIPAGNLTVIAGDPEQGKSMFTCLLAAELSARGEEVLMANAEDSPARVRDRLLAAGADLTRVRPVEGLVLPDGVERLRQQVIDTGASLVVLDPYTAYLADRINAVRDAQVRAALLPLVRLAEEHGTAVVIVCHLLRGDSEGNPIYRIPVGLRGIARSILSMRRGDGVTKLLHSKSAYGERQPPLTYQFDGARLIGGSRRAKAGRDGSTLILDYIHDDD